LDVVEGNRMRVRRVEVIDDYAKITPTSTNFLIPLEVIARYYVAGSLYDRLAKGRIRPEDVGFARGHVAKYGEPLPEPFLETTTKLEKVDRELTVDEALRISSLSKGEYEELQDLVFRIDERLNTDVRRRGLIHVDGKKEFAFDEARELMVIDTFGTADEDRFWDREAYDQGKQVELSKEFVRQHYRQTRYHAALTEAREQGRPEPEIPALPDDVLAKVSELYVALFERLTGERFR
jgi:phosphoribosylaminoimidazole-succinocarboxamide synthase